MDTDKSFTVFHHGEEFDIYKFLKLHPGGQNYLQPYKDKEITERMKHMKHSTSAYHLLKQYKTEGSGMNDESLDDLDNLVDLDKPILSQIGKLGERYYEWVMLPCDKRLRIFQSNFWERLSFTPWYVVPLVWIPLISCQIFFGIKRYVAMTQDPSPFLPILLHTIWGVIIWTMVEYSLHRWIFHVQPSGKSKAMIYFHFLIHGIHHKAPYDVYRLVFPPFPAAIIAYILYLVLSPFFVDSAKYLTSAGVYIGYVIYDMIHFYLHFGRPVERSYFYYLKRYHLQHHFVHHHKGFGISNDFWDIICGSLIRLNKLSKNIKW